MCMYITTSIVPGKKQKKNSAFVQDKRLTFLVANEL